MDDHPPIIAWPSDDERKAAFELYTCALGKVVFAWNYLHERLAYLHALAMQDTSDREKSFATWYRIYNDKKQRKLLRVAARQSGLSKKAKSDIVWLTEEIDTFAEARNDAVHAPASLYVEYSPGHTSPIMGTAFINGHPRAIRMMGRNLVEEFRRYEVRAETMSKFAIELETAIVGGDDYDWPYRPS